MNLHPMKITINDIAQAVGGKVEGQGDLPILGPSKIEEGVPGTITFLANPKYESHIYTTQASAVLVGNDFIPQKPVAATLVRVADVYGAISLLLERFGAAQQSASGASISDKASVHPTAQLEEGVAVGDFSIVEAGASIGAGSVLYGQVYIGRDVRIGKNVVLHPGVKVYHACVLGDDCILHANVVIGADGFGFAPQQDGSYKKVPQVGNVVLGKRVEVGANTTIDRATMGSTTIGNGVKLDNLVQIAHNVEIGDNTVIASQTGVAGSTRIGSNCMVGGQVGFAGHLKIADGTKIQAQSGIASSVTKPNTALFGSPAIDYGAYVRAYVLFKQLPELEKRLRELERKLKEE